MNFTPPEIPRERPGKPVLRIVFRHVNAPRTPPDGHRAFGTLTDHAEAYAA
jgi:hypothetical protein